MKTDIKKKPQIL